VFQFKKRLILLNTQDFDPLSCIENGQMNITEKTFKKLFKKQFSVFLSILPIFNLGIFSFSNLNFENQYYNINNISEISEYKEDVNSQNMIVLEPANHRDPNPSKGGGDINIIDESVLASESGVLGTNFDIEKASGAGSISTYQVREGDTLSEIADMFDVSVNTIRWANDLEGSITPGQSLVILPVTGITHIVKNGGNIEDLAEIYHADVQEIALFNGIDITVDLKPGDEIIIPNVDLSHEGVSTSNSSNNKHNTRVAESNSSNYFINPVPGAIITQGLHGYNGIDIASNYGTPIYASASGKVITSKQGGWNGGYGNYIVISHANGTQTLYSHNSENIVYVGQNVNKGDLIAKMGSTGRSTGNHLHFEVRGATNPLAACAYNSVCK